MSVTGESDPKDLAKRHTKKPYISKVIEPLFPHRTRRYMKGIEDQYRQRILVPFPEPNFPKVALVLVGELR